MDCLKEYGKKILSDLVIERTIDILPESVDIKCIEQTIEYISKIVNIDFSLYNMYFCEKENITGFKMKWHVDDAQLIKHKTGKAFPDQIIVSDKKVLNYNNKKPKYTCIIYLSEYMKDFSGGTIEFVNQIIEPKNRMFIFFDSKEVHRVNIIKNGIRKNYLIKFYEK